MSILNYYLLTFYDMIVVLLFFRGFDRLIPSFDRFIPIRIPVTKTIR